MVSHGTRHLPPGTLMDLNLLFIGVLIPLANVNFFFTLPTFHVERPNWHAFSVVMLSLGAGLGEFTLPHLCLHWAMSTPFIM